MTEEQVFSQIPDFQRVGSLYSYDGGLRSGDDGLPNATLLNHGRVYYDQETPFLLPVEYRWEPELHYAPTEFTRGLFEHMVAASAHRRLRRPAAPGLPRGPQPDPGHPRPAAGRRSPTGSWRRSTRCGSSTASRPRTGSPPTPSRLLGFPAGREPGQAGYTVVRPQHVGLARGARRRSPATRYRVPHRPHRPPPTRASFDGIDWARIWGGRYRFMMVDLGAAPNGYESETWANRAKSVLGSALFDPPLWELRAGLPYPVDFTSACYKGSTACPTPSTRPTRSATTTCTCRSPGW